MVQLLADPPLSAAETTRRLLRHGILPPLRGYAPPAEVQGAIIEKASNTTDTIIVGTGGPTGLTTALVVGHYLIVAIACNQVSATTVNAPTITGGDAFTLVGEITNTANVSAHVYIKKIVSGDISGGASTITITKTSVARQMEVGVWEWSGLDATSPISITAVTSTSGSIRTTHPTGQLAGPVTAGDVVFAWIAEKNGDTTMTDLGASPESPTTGWTFNEGHPAASGAAKAAAARLYQIAAGQSNIEAVSSSGAASQHDASVIFALKAASSGTLYTQTLTAGFTPSAAISRSTSRNLAGGITPSGVLPKRPARNLAGGVTPAGAIASLKVRLVGISAGLTPGGALPKLTSRALSAALSSSATITKTAGLPLSAGLAPSAVIAKSSLRPLAAGVAPSAQITKRPARAVSASVALGGLVAPVKNAGVKFQALTAALALSGAIQKRRAKPISGGLTFAGAAQGPWYLVGDISPWPPPFDDVQTYPTDDPWVAQWLYDHYYNQGDYGLRPDLYAGSPSGATIPDPSAMPYQAIGDLSWDGSSFTLNTLNQGEFLALPAGAHGVYNPGDTWTDPFSGRVFNVGGWHWLRNLDLTGRFVPSGAGAVGAGRPKLIVENCRIRNRNWASPTIATDIWAPDAETGYFDPQDCFLLARNIDLVYPGQGNASFQANNVAGSLRSLRIHRYQQDAFKVGNGSGDFWVAGTCLSTHPALRGYITDPPPAGATSYGRVHTENQKPNGDLVFLTVAAFLVGDENITVEYVNDGPSRPLTITIESRAAGAIQNVGASTAGSPVFAPAGPSVRVHLATDSSSVVTSTAAQIMALINTDAGSAPLISASLYQSQNGSDIGVVPIGKAGGTPVQLVLVEVPSNKNGGIPHSDSEQLFYWDQTGFVPRIQADGSLIDAGERFVTDPTYPGKLGTCVHRQMTYQANHEALAYFQLGWKANGLAARYVVLDQCIGHGANGFVSVAWDTSAAHGANNPLNWSWACGAVDSFAAPVMSRHWVNRPPDYATNPYTGRSEPLWIDVGNRVIGTDSRANPTHRGLLPHYLAGDAGGATFSAALPASSATPLGVSRGKGFAAVSTFAGSAQRRTGRLVAAGLAPSGTVTRSASRHRALTAALTLSAGVTRSTSRAITAALGLAGTAGRAARKTFVATLPTGGQAQPSHVSLRTLAAGFAPTAAIQKLTQRALAAGLAPAGGMLKVLARSLAGGFAPTGSVLTVKIGVLAKTFAATLGLGGAQSRVTGRSIDASLAPTGLFAHTTNRAITATLGISAALTRTTTRALAAALGLAGGIVPLQLKALAVNASLGVSGALRRVTARALSAGLTPSGGVPLRMQQRAASATLGLSGLLAGATTRVRSFTASLPLVGVATPRVQRALDATLSLVGAVARGSQRALAASLSLDAAMQTLWNRKRSTHVFDAASPTSDTFDSETPTGGWDAQ